MSTQLRSVYEFGPFRLYPSEHLLIRDGIQVSLTPKAFQTLLVLIEHRGRLIGKDELINQIWPDETFSPDGDFIYYSKNERGKGNSDRVLYQIPVLGGASRKLLVGVATPVTFSPDGNRFAFVRVSADEGETSLMIANADGSGEQRLGSLKGDEWFSYSGLAWSPDGKVIASGVGSANGGSHMTVVAVRVEDGTQREITSHRWFNLERVAWLADGGGLVLNAADQGTYSKQIWEVSYPDGEARRITNDLNDYHQISLTRDSNTLVTVQENETSNVWITRKEDTGRAKQITPGKDEGRRGISWTSDGKIVYTSDVSGNSNIWIMDEDGANQKQLTTDPRMDRRPSVSPDGRYVVFSSNRTGTLNLWRMDIDGSNPKQLTGGSDDLSPQYSPDSRWVVFSSWEPGRQVLFKVPGDGGDPVQLTDKLSPELGVSPDES